MKHSAKSLIGLSALSVCVLMNGAAQAKMHSDSDGYAATPNNWYLGASGDLTWLSHSSTGGGGNVDLGYRFSDFRAEAEAGYHAASGDTGFSDTHYFSYMGNLYYDFRSMFPATGSNWHVVPYIGAGLGDAGIHRGSSSFSGTFHNNDNSLAWDGMAGFSFTPTMMPGTEWSLGYRYLGTSKDDLHANNLELGVRFPF